MGGSSAATRPVDAHGIEQPRRPEPSGECRWRRSRSWPHLRLRRDQRTLPPDISKPWRCRSQASASRLGVSVAAVSPTLGQVLLLASFFVSLVVNGLGLGTPGLRGLLVSWVAIGWAPLVFAIYRSEMRDQAAGVALGGVALIGFLLTARDLWTRRLARRHAERNPLLVEAKD